MSVRLYVEGGGDSKSLRTACRRGFRLFLEKAGLRGRMPRIVACGPRNSAFEDFSVATKSSSGTAVLLVDSEGPVSGVSPWTHVATGDGWERPAGASEDQCHLMVQLMESWFLADPSALSEFYGPKFDPKALPAASMTESVAKTTVVAALRRATRHSTKGAYAKAEHSFALLGLIDPAKVAERSPHAKRFIETMANWCR